MILTSSLSLRLMLATLPAMAAAFLHSTINTHPRQTHRPRLRHTTVIGAEFNAHSYINKVLNDKQNELLSDMSALQKLHPQSTVEADNELRDISTEQMVKESIISTRLSLPLLNRTKLGPSTIKGAGRGLFATEMISKGEVITCYPADALLYEMPSPDEIDDLHEHEEGDYDEDDEEDDFSEQIILWGAHVPSSDRWDDDTVFDGSELHPKLTAYAVSIDDFYSNMGHPQLDDNPAYFGHFVNDGAGHLALEKPNSQSNIEAALELGLDTEAEEEDIIGVEGNIAAYVFKSLEVSNAIHKPVNDDETHMVTVATRDIDLGEEILVTYGPDYWLGHC